MTTAPQKLVSLQKPILNSAHSQHAIALGTAKQVAKPAAKNV